MHHFEGENTKKFLGRGTNLTSTGEEETPSPDPTLIGAFSASI